LDFTLDADQLALQDVARQALASDFDGALLRDLAEDPEGITPALWGRFVDLGWTGLLVPEDLGGAGAGLL
jgi:acyl-CoA dehydrogenase